MSTEKILIVEDEGVAAMSLEDKLLGLGYRSAGIAFSADEALQMAEKEHPDLVLMDIQLRGAPDGIEAARQIRGHLEIPVVFITAFSDDATIERAKQTAPLGYLMKPYREQSIKTTVEIALNSFHLEKKLRESEQDFRALFELSPAGIALIDPGHRVVRANPTLATLLGYASPAEIEGHRMEDFLREDEPNRASTPEAPLFPDTPTPRSGEWRALTRAQGEIWVRIDSCQVHDTKADQKLGLCLFTDITLQKELEADLKSRSEALQESNERLQQFTSVASHDLRAPARAARQLLCLISRGYGNRIDQRGQELLGLAIQETKKLEATVDELFEYTKVCHSPSQPSPIFLVKVMRDTLAILSPEIEEKRADIGYEPLPTVAGCESQLRRLFANLLGNAMKYSHKRPKIRVTAITSENEHIVSFADNGVGIDERERDRIFEMFYRGSRLSEHSGSGIGLASCRKVMENHHGRIWVTSRSEGGSVFHLAFPRGTENA